MFKSNLITACILIVGCSAPNKPTPSHVTTVKSDQLGLRSLWYIQDRYLRVTIDGREFATNRRVDADEAFDRLDQAAIVPNMEVRQQHVEGLYAKVAAYDEQILKLARPQLSVDAEEHLNRLKQSEESAQVKRANLVVQIDQLDQQIQELRRRNDIASRRQVYKLLQARLSIAEEIDDLDDEIANAAYYFLATYIPIGENVLIHGLMEQRDIYGQKLHAARAAVEDAYLTKNAIFQLKLLMCDSFEVDLTVPSESLKPMYALMQHLRPIFESLAH